jgi:hypothetical protein
MLQTTPLDLREDIRYAISTRLSRISRLVPDLSPETVDTVVDSWLQEITDPDPKVQRASLLELIRTLYPDDRVPLEFWTRPLGRQVLATIGYHHDHVPLAVVASMLGYSRQAIYQMANRGVLTKVKHEGMWFITADSLRDLYQVRGPRRNNERHHYPRP